MKLKQLLEARYVTRDFDPITIKRLVHKLVNGELVKKNSGPNTFYYSIPDFKIALDNLNVQFGKPWCTGYIKRREDDMAYYIWIVSGWKVKLSAEDMKVEVWEAGNTSLIDR